MSDETTKTMRDLLERWAATEPGRCRLNFNWKPANGDNNYYIVTQADDSEGWQLVCSDAEPNCYFPNKNEALGRIQWAVQAAIVGRGWSFILTYNHGYKNSFYAKVCIDKENCINLSGSNLTEALLAAYVRVLEKTK